jgi:hypothetical protein
LRFYYYESIPDQSLIQINMPGYLDENGVSETAQKWRSDNRAQLR